MNPIDNKLSTVQYARNGHRDVVVPARARIVCVPVGALPTLFFGPDSNMYSPSTFLTP